MRRVPGNEAPFEGLGRPTDDVAPERGSSRRAVQWAGLVAGPLLALVVSTLLPGSRRPT